jgi:hypothetical protein
MVAIHPRYIYLYHILVVAPSIMWLSYKKGNVPDIVYNNLAVIAVFVMLFHGYKLSKLYENNIYK